ncbi:MAG: hypothetical protein ACREQ5_00940 [Candidatus Dormibacteria bacterium]
MMVIWAVSAVSLSLASALLLMRLVRVEHALAATLGLLVSTLEVVGTQPGPELPPELQRFIHTQGGAHRT